jgi:hypothetical protein
MLGDCARSFGYRIARCGSNRSHLFELEGTVQEPNRIMIKRISPDPKFRTLVDDLKTWLRPDQQASVKAARINSAAEVFGPTFDFLVALNNELNYVERSISIQAVEKWKEGPDQKCSLRYHVSFQGRVCHVLIFTVQDNRIEFDGHVFDVGNQAALEQTLGKLIVEALKR